MNLALPTSARGRAILVGGAIVIAAVAGAVAQRELIQGGAAIRTSTLSELNGTRQGLVHTGPPSGHPYAPFLGPFAHNHKGIKECGPAVRLMEGALKRKGFRHDRIEPGVLIREVQAQRRPAGVRRPEKVLQYLLNRRPLGHDASRDERHERAEPRVLDEPGPQLDTRRSHRLHDHRAAHAGRRLLHGRRITQREPDAAALGLVRARLGQLDGDRHADLDRGGHRIGRRLGRALGHDREPV